ncbi:L-fuculose-phosphate aldolase [Neorhodopirellula lusitana]|uniref:L-fuculose-phosphate aldolase n=1 Tax=Neorhodopirellula lusitana TaxID=445327 RepID=A0ABY1PSC6_9BACT|nr:class II aldolase/adducin family protein [Neorhodopirellula lusitana]SMP44401.1 L-fuculose-phosphate aldolase [Neorhodopirellula lusitana]
MSIQRPLIHPRDEIMQTMSRIYGYRMTTTSGGNLSIREENGDIWISPARVDKGNLTRNDIVCVKADGSTEGLHPPSSEFPFHKAIYAARPDIRAIVHAHPVALVAFSICHAAPNTRLFHQTHSISGNVGFAPYACPGSEELGQSIAATFAQGCDSVILENHGVVVGSDSLASAFERFEAFEFAGKTSIKANQLGTVRYLDDAQLKQAANRSVKLPTFEPGIATEQERELRLKLCQFLKRGCRQRLLISTEGSFSARLGDDSYLITPTQKDRESLSIDDLVLVKDGHSETGKKPSRAALAHQAIYAKHPDVQAIVFAHPVNGTAFSVTDVKFDTRTIPESYVFLLDVAHVPYGVQYQNDGSIADHVSPKGPAAILENDGVLVTGSSILDAFDRLEVLESTAEAVINAKAIGDVSAMSQSVIDELRSAFNLG